MSPKRIIDAKADSDGDITAVRFEGNQNFTSVDRAVPMADRGEIKGIHAVHPKNGQPYLRSNPDGRKRNNLDEMATR